MIIGAAAAAAIGRVAAPTTQVYSVNSADTNGSSQYFTVTNGTTFDGLTEFSLEVYFKADSLHTGRLFDKWNAGSQSFIFRWNSDGTLTGFVSSDGTNSTTVTSDTTLSINTWYHAVFNYTGSQLEIYVDGALDCTPVSYTSTIHNNATSMHLCAGATQAIQYYNGKSSFAIAYDQSLSSSEISTRYNSGIPKCYGEEETTIKNKMWGFWDLCNWTGHTSQELTDQTGGGNNLTNTGSTPFTGTGLSVECTPATTAFYDTLLLNGTSQYVNLGQDASINLGDGDKSHSVWFKTSSGNRQMIFGSGDPVNGPYFEITVRAGGTVNCYAQLNTTDVINYYTNSTFNDGLFHNLVVLWNSYGVPNIYIDGVDETLTAAEADTITNISTGAETWLGARDYTSNLYFDGSLSIPIIFDATITAGDIAELQTPKQPENYSTGLKSKYACALPLNDGVIDPENDRSANNNDGTLVGSPTYTGQQLEFTL